MANTVLLIDKSRNRAEALGTYLKRQQADVTIAGTNEEVIVSIEKTVPEIILADPYLADGEIVYILKQTKKAHPLTQIIIVSEPEQIDQAMETFRSDVAGYLSRPIRSHALDLAMKQAKDRIALEKNWGAMRRKSLI